ncbi:MAG: hypothetical protein WCO16_01525 [bacterium]
MKLFKLKTTIRRYFARIFQLHRPASYPYLSGDGFRAIANFIYDQFLDFDPTLVMRGDIIFVRNNCLHEFFIKIHPLIKESYVLVSNNEDATIGSDFTKHIDEKIIHWYSQNLLFRHPKVTVLPIGIQNFTVGHDENFIHAFSKINIDPKKQNRILYGFTHNDTVPERVLVHSVLSKLKNSDYVNLPRSEYYKKLNTYKFIASPRGGGLDCHRTWEALYFKVIPIIVRNTFSEQLLELGFPILLIDNWTEVETFSEEFLTDYYEKNKDKFGTPKLYLPYWYEKFINHKS